MEYTLTWKSPTTGYKYHQDFDSIEEAVNELEKLLALNIQAKIIDNVMVKFEREIERQRNRSQHRGLRALELWDEIAFREPYLFWLNGKKKQV